MATKKIAPNGLDFAMAEHIGGGETYLEAALRGFMEELSLHIDPSDLTLTGIIGPMLERQLPYFSAIYMYESEVEPDYNREDFQDASWLTTEQLLEQLAAGVEARHCSSQR